MRAHIQTLHNKAITAAKTYFCAECDLIEALMSLGRDHGYRDFNRKSLAEYARMELGLSEDPAGTLCRLAAKCGEFPRLLEQLRSGEVSITNARLICAILTEENQDRWLAAAAHLSKAELEAALASEFPERAIKELLKPVSDQLWKLQVGLSNDQKEKLVRAQARKQKKVPSRDGGPGRKRPPAEVLHAVALRDHDQCDFRYEDGSRCASRRWINQHHIIHFADGGPDTVGNLQTLCFQDHALLHHTPFGARETDLFFH